MDDATKFAPQAGITNNISLFTGSRFYMAMVRTIGTQTYLWTCQHGGVDGTDKDYGGTQTGSTRDRSAIQWLKLAINPTATPPLAFSDHDRICDVASSTPYYYYMPSLAVNSSAW
ncbi:MAG TPA: hypothetical protein VGR78_10795, partial [Verrucomicrobiae bacterium]|nr:hypothetical protein [Verrucomicrobiae bacterium]